MRLLVIFLTFVFAFGSSPTTDIKVNQAGYLTDARKLAMVVTSTAASEFTIRTAENGSVTFSGSLSAASEDADSGDRVQVADFSELKKPGKYFLEIPGVGRSWEFEIGSKVYSRAFHLAMRSFYGQRCGTAVDLGAEFPGYQYPACHTEGAYHVSSGKSGPAPSSKGWHDAGDYGRYIVNSGITTGTLLWAWELFGPRLEKVNLQIPESGNHVPDVLNEIKWNLDWMLTMQDEDGGVWHKQTSENFCGFVMPDQDEAVSYVIGTGSPSFKGACATADFAAVMAIAARVYKPFDASYSAACLEAARQAWKWVEKNPGVLFNNPSGVGTGAYGDRSCADELLWASAELWRTTGDEPYHRYFLDHFTEFRERIRTGPPPAWPDVAPLGFWSYALSPKNDDKTSELVRGDIKLAADAIVERSARHPYRISMTTRDYVWGSNGVAANYGVQLLVANAIQPDKRYMETALDNLHYLLGRNTFSLSWVTRVGANPFQNPHHRPSGADSNREPWPGLLAGGPNRSPQDDAMRRLPKLPPARMYVDDQESYASNENAINWNAPLVFLLAGAVPELQFSISEN
jgi:endoglucanase